MAFVYLRTLFTLSTNILQCNIERASYQEHIERLFQELPFSYPKMAVDFLGEMYKAGSIDFVDPNTPI